MIDLYAWDTPNGRRAAIMLEESGLPYVVRPVNLPAGAQLTAAYRAINPNSKIPAIIDHDAYGRGPLTVFETGAILVYLAEKARILLPADPRARAIVWQWLLFHSTNLGPIGAQWHHFTRQIAEPVPYGAARYHREMLRLYGVMDERLNEAEFFAGEYSIADIAAYPWIARFSAQDSWRPIDQAEIPLHAYPRLQRWFDAVGRRSAVARGMTLLSEKTGSA